MDPYTDFDFSALDPATRQQMLTFLCADPASRQRALEVLSPSMQSLTESPSLVSPEFWTNQPDFDAFDVGAFDQELANWDPSFSGQAMLDDANAANDWMGMDLQGDFE